MSVIKLAVMIITIITGNSKKSCSASFVNARLLTQAVGLGIKNWFLLKTGSVFFFFFLIIVHNS